MDFWSSRRSFIYALQVEEEAPNGQHVLVVLAMVDEQTHCCLVSIDKLLR